MAGKGVGTKSGRRPSHPTWPIFLADWLIQLKVVLSGRFLKPMSAVVFRDYTLITKEPRIDFPINK